MIQILVLVGGVSALLLVTLQLHAKPILGLYALVIVAFSAWEYPGSPTIAAFAGLRVSVLDAIAAAALCAAILHTSIERPNLSSTRTRQPLLITALVVLAALGALRGIGAYGIGPALNEGRLVLLPTAILLWTLSVDWAQYSIRQFENLALFGGWGLTIVGIYHALTTGIGDASSAVTVDGFGQTGRILVSGQALLLAAFVVVTVGFACVRYTHRLAFSAATFTAIVFLAQHRSVWAALLTTSLVVWLCLQRGPRERVLVWAVVGAGILGMFIAFAQDTALVQQITASSSDTRTYNARTNSWIPLLRNWSEGSVANILVGQPFGYGFMRYENGNLILFQPHNWYVTTILRMGIIGLLAWVTVLISAVRSLVVSNSLSALALLTLIVVYSWTYGIDPYLAPVAGLALAATQRRLQPSARAEMVKA